MSASTEMQLWLTVSADGARRAVEVHASSAHTVGDLLVALCREVGSGVDPERVVLDVGERTLDPALEMGDSGLRSGDEVVLSTGAPRPPKRPGRNEFVVVGGPAMGTRPRLGPGTHVVGRSSNADVVIGDESISRRHLEIRIADEAIEVLDAGSSNGAFIDGERIDDRPRPIAPSDIVELGQSLVSVRPAVDPARPRTDGVGRVPFNRPPRVAQPQPEAKFSLAVPPKKTRSRHLPLGTALIPLLFGVVMFLVVKNPSMLLFALLSPIMAFYSVWEDRRSATKDRSGSVNEFRSDLAQLDGEMSAAYALRQRERWASAPDAADLLNRARAATPSLWERGPRDNDFLAVRLGWADQPSGLIVDLNSDADKELRAEAGEAIERYSTARAVPVIVSIVEVGVVGLAEDANGVRGLGLWIMTQLACLQSSRDVVFVAALPPSAEAGWSWLRWLPHTRSDTSPIEGAHVALTSGAAVELLDQLNALVATRTAAARDSLANRARSLPEVVVVLHEEVKLSRSAVSSLLSDGPAVGVRILWLGSDRAQLPEECGVVAEVQAGAQLEVVFPATGARVIDGAADAISETLAWEFAYALAPVHDVTARGAAGRAPRQVSLLEVLGMADFDAESLIARWARAEGVAAPVGAGAEAPFVLDLRHDGPHALAGGTTGSGKSEFLQSLVASFAATYPPNRVAFVLVDYKGGAAFKDCVHLPHTVGFVTDLDGSLTNRALISLNAELRRREHLLKEAGAKDLIDLERLAPESAPPSLVLIIDEFATLAKELPEFVEGVVDVAQRGRSLGIHLMLATQRPAGSVNDNIRANTNLRVALRMNDEADSDDVIGNRAAAHIPRSIPGRGYARVGQGELAEFQTAYVGGVTSATAERPLRVAPLSFDDGPTRSAESSVDESAETDQQRLVSAAVAAADALGIARPPSPWLPPLPAVLALDALLDGADTGADRPPLGLADEPANQAQPPWYFDLENDGSLLVYGTSGSGKTTLLRTLATSLCRSASPSDVWLYGLDFGTRGLGALEAFPHCGSVIGGDDVDRVTRLFAFLRRTVQQRAQLFAQLGVSSLSEYRRASGSEDVARIVVLLDGFSAFASTFEKVDFGELLEVFPQLVNDGRPTGVHFAVTADRRTAVPSTIASVFQRTLVLRMTSDDDYGAIGVDMRGRKGAALANGRALVTSGGEFQIAVVGADPSGEAQQAAVRATGEALRATYPSGAPPIGALPSEVDASEIEATPTEGWALVGLLADDLSPVDVNLLHAHFLVVGPHRSGRTEALGTLARSFAASTPGAELRLLVPRRSTLTDLSCWTSVARGADECEAVAMELEALVNDRTDDREGPLIVFVDDAEELADGAADFSLETVAKRGRDRNVFVVAACERTSAQRAYGGVLGEVRKDHQGIVLMPDTDLDGDIYGVRLPRKTSLVFPPGRGYLVRTTGVQLVQVAR